MVRSIYTNARNVVRQCESITAVVSLKLKFQSVLADGGDGSVVMRSLVLGNSRVAL